MLVVIMLHYHNLSSVVLMFFDRQKVNFQTRIRGDPHSKPFRSQNNRNTVVYIKEKATMAELFLYVE